MLQDEKFKYSLRFSLSMLIIMWLLKVFESISGIELFVFGLLPRTVEGIPGIFTSIFIHGGYNHLLANTLPFLLLTTSLIYFYRNQAVKILFFCISFSGILLWILGRSSYHIGASGIIYALASYFFFNGLFNRNVKAITLSLIVVFLYSGLLSGILPVDASISWEGHLFGAISGFLAVLFFSDKNDTKKYDWEDEDISHLPPPEISYKKGYPFE